MEAELSREGEDGTRDENDDESVGRIREDVTHDDKIGQPVGIHSERREGGRV